MRLGLEVVQPVYDALGRPGALLPTVHLVGTNGKGSTAALVEHALRGRGRRTGLYTSPHLHRLGERVRLGGEPVDDARLGAHLEAVRRVEASLPLPRPLSFFELLTLAALDLMAGAGVDALVVEAGLGARRDATRVVTATAVGITSIGLDHVEVLGPTVVDIARDKAGAMAPGVPAFTAPQAPEVLEVLRAEARAVGCPLTVVEPRPRAPAGLPGEHQRHNAAVALAVARVLLPGPMPAVADAELDGVRVPGRLEPLPWAGGELWVDVAHNPEGIAAVVAAIESQAVPRPSVVVFGCHPDKDRDAMLERLRGLGRPLWWVPCGGPSEGGEAPDADRRFSALDDPALASAVEAELAAGGRVLACGSHAVAAALRARALGLVDPADPQDPRPDRPRPLPASP